MLYKSFQNSFRNLITVAIGILSKLLKKSYQNCYRNLIKIPKEILSRLLKKSYQNCYRNLVTISWRNLSSITEVSGSLPGWVGPDEGFVATEYKKEIEFQKKKIKSELFWKYCHYPAQARGVPWLHWLVLIWLSLRMSTVSVSIVKGFLSQLKSWGLWE